MTSNNLNLIEFLSHSTELSQQFKQIYFNSISIIQSIKSSKNQQINLESLPEKSRMKLPGIQRVQIVIEESINSLKGELEKMKLIVESYQTLLTLAELNLQNPTSSLSSSLNPTQVLKSISTLSTLYQFQSIQFQQLFIGFTTGLITLEELSLQWNQVTIETERETELSELSDIMAQWGQTSNLD